MKYQAPRTIKEINHVMQHGSWRNRRRLIRWMKQHSIIEHVPPEIMAELQSHRALKEMLETTHQGEAVNLHYGDRVYVVRMEAIIKPGTNRITVHD